MNQEIFVNDTINYEALCHPPAFFWPSFMWLWNGKLDNDVIRKRLEEFKEIGSKTIWTLPISRDFSKEIPSTLDKEFLSDEFFEVFKKFLDDTDELGLVNWITDEPSYPSGGLCGKLVERNPEIRAKYLYCEELQVECPYTVPEQALIAFSEGKSYKKGEVIPVGAVSVVFIGEFPDDSWIRPYPDILKKESVDLYIEACYEKYKEQICDRFGSSVLAVFDDEASCIITPPWNDEFEERFYDRYGYSLTENILALFKKSSDEKDCQVRIDFADMWSDSISENYFGRLKKWCNDNGLLFIGHLGGDHKTDASALYAMGSTFKCLRNFDIPGVDVIWRQLFPDGNRHITADFGNGLVYEYPDNMPDKDHHFAKFASSIAHQGKYPYALTESFAIYGSGITFSLMKKLVDFQYVRGINLLTMSCSKLDETGSALVGARPDFHPSNPTFRHMRAFQEYTARLSYLLSRGRATADSCLYLPIRDFWAKSDDYDMVVAENDRFAEALIDNRVEFDFVDDIAIEKAALENGCLQVGSMAYRRIFITRSHFMSALAKDKLAAFEKLGGEVIFVDERTTVDPALGCCLVRSQNPHIKVMKRTLKGAELYFVVNEGDKTVERMAFFCVRPCYLFNPEEARFQKAVVDLTTDSTELTYAFDAWESLVLLFADDEVAYTETAPYANTVLAEITECRLQKNECYVITSNDIVRTAVDDEAVSAAFGDWQAYLGKEFSGTATYSFCVFADEQMARTARYIDLGSLSNHCALYLNGEYIGEKGWAPFTFDIEGKLKSGDNLFEARVTNTLANQYVNTTALDGYVEGIGPYHVIAKEFEKQDTASGIFKNPLIKC